MGSLSHTGAPALPGAPATRVPSPRSPGTSRPPSVPLPPHSGPLRNEKVEGPKGAWNFKKGPGAPRVSRHFSFSCSGLPVSNARVITSAQATVQGCADQRRNCGALCSSLPEGRGLSGSSTRHP